MMVLSRKKNESLIINGNIIVTVVEIRGDKVRLGVELPKDMPIHRKEVYDALRRHDDAAPDPFPVYQPDQVDHLAAALQSRLGVLVHREVVLQAMREARIDVSNVRK
jgi:carbon storage regulator